MLTGRWLYFKRTWMLGVGEVLNRRHLLALSNRRNSGELLKLGLHGWERNTKYPFMGVMRVADHVADLNSGVRQNDLDGERRDKHIAHHKLPSLRTILLFKPTAGQVSILVTGITFNRRYFSIVRSFPKEILTNPIRILR